MLVNTILLLLWLMFVLVWTISSVSTKKDIRGHRTWWKIGLIRVMLIVLIIAVFRVPGVKGFISHYTFTDSDLAALGAITLVGLAIAVAGIAFAFWARWHLGRNWSSHPTLKEDHELITTGPYKYVRHPIYTGFLVAMFGSGLAGGLVWWLFFVVFCILFIPRVKIEENLMMKQFPSQYPEYKAHSNALIPWFW